MAAEFSVGLMGRVVEEACGIPVMDPGTLLRIPQDTALSSSPPKSLHLSGSCQAENPHGLTPHGSSFE